MLSDGENLQICEPIVESLSIDVVDLVSVRHGAVDAGPDGAVQQCSVPVVVIPGSLVVVPGGAVPQNEGWLDGGFWVSIV
jgi:hypothetical protein